MPRPFTERRACLEALSLGGPTWATSPSFPGEGTTTQEVAESRHFEGVVAKRLESTYLPGQRSPAWTKVKDTKRDEFVVGGWLPGEGNREGRIGALLVGLPDGEGGLTYCGGVGTGFTDKELRRLKQRLDPLVTTTSPFTRSCRSMPPNHRPPPSPPTMTRVPFGVRVRRRRANVEFPPMSRIRS